MKSSAIKLTTLFDNECRCTTMKSLWGFSCLVETPDHTILFDTGSNGRILLQNIQVKEIDVKKIDTLFISHAHWDHIGGLDSILESNPHVRIFVTSHFSKNLVRDLNTLSNGVTVIGNEPSQIFPHIYSTGAMGEEGEQSLIIETDNGLIILAGCAHSGIRAITERAKVLFNQEILLLLGGFHLFNKEEEKIIEVVQSIKNLGTRYVCPSHCTGEKAKELFEKAFGSYYIDGGAGVEVSFGIISK